MAKKKKCTRIRRETITADQPYFNRGMRAMTKQGYKLVSSEYRDGGTWTRPHYECIFQKT